VKNREIYADRTDNSALDLHKATLIHARRGSALVPARVSRDMNNMNKRRAIYGDVTARRNRAVPVARSLARYVNIRKIEVARGALMYGRARSD